MSARVIASVEQSLASEKRAQLAPRSHCIGIVLVHDANLVAVFIHSIAHRDQEPAPTLGIQPKPGT